MIIEKWSSLRWYKEIGCEVIPGILESLPWLLLMFLQVIPDSLDLNVIWKALLLNILLSLTECKKKAFSVWLDAYLFTYLCIFVNEFIYLWYSKC